jgi:hypothetical protein
MAFLEDIGAADDFFDDLTEALKRDLCWGLSPEDNRQIFSSMPPS